MVPTSGVAGPYIYAPGKRNSRPSKKRIPQGYRMQAPTHQPPRSTLESTVMQEVDTVPRVTCLFTPFEETKLQAGQAERRQGRVEEEKGDRWASGAPGPNRRLLCLVPRTRARSSPADLVRHPLTHPPIRPPFSFGVEYTPARLLRVERRCMCMTPPPCNRDYDIYDVGI